MVNPPPSRVVYPRCAHPGLVPRLPLPSELGTPKGLGERLGCEPRARGTRWRDGGFRSPELRPPEAALSGGKRRKAPSRRQRVGAGGHLAVVVWIALGRS